MSDPTIVTPGIIQPTVKQGPWVQGPPGTPGANGEQGPPGPGRDIDDATVNGDGDLIITYSDNTTQNAGHVVGADGANGTIGVDGANAYVVAVEQGFSGTPDEWLDSLQGADGAQGEQGPQGPQGNSGITSAELTGDVTGTLTNGIVETTLTNSGVTPGAYKGILKTFGVNEKGLVYGVATPFIGGDVSITEDGGDILTTLSTTGVTAGTYGLFGLSFTTDLKGRITSASQVSTIAAGGDIGLISFANTPIPIFNLTNTGVTPGTYTKVTTDAKGRITAGESLSSGDVTTALGFTPISANQTITLSGDASGSGTTAVTLTLANTGVAAGNYGLVNLAVDSKGRITSISNATSIPATSIRPGATETVVTLSPVANAVNLDLSQGSYFVINVTSNVAITANNAPATGAFGFTVELISDGTTRGVTYMANTGWDGDVSPVVPNVLNRKVIAVFSSRNAGVNYSAGIAMANVA
ncbi:hypothetical protein [Phenylobacterium sp. SCN 70-31]|uniref:hypothetical protein n=1 Tax=Phenylobacterium sp. SCN 70-31 TaxID=1660129 RepID=UPI000B2B26C3|nr:hypothetical protein [Phenylobacterium sp. SCN 70-31]